MNYLKIYDDVFSNNKNYNIHIGEKIRYEFVLNEIIQNKYYKVIDISSGRGNLIKYIWDINKNINITSTDLKKFNNLNVNFIKLDLIEKNNHLKIINNYEFLSCLDVLEHIEEKYIEEILLFFSSIANNFCFTIANHSDIKNGMELHLIQKDKIWWDEVLKKHFIIKKSFSSFNDKLYSYVLKNID